MKNITLAIGSGGKDMHAFINEYIVKKLGNSSLNRMDDASVIMPTGKRIAFTTDSYVVSPIFFDGGDIGRLCVCGTVNDLSTTGAKPVALSLAFILEDGVSLDDICKIIDSIAATCKEADVKIITGDTKVVEKGKGDKDIYKYLRCRLYRGRDQHLQSPCGRWRHRHCNWTNREP